MSNISVIVPVYKVEKYLNLCVESILQQTYSDFELILVDDGSPDNCGKMCDEWALKDKRIRVIHKENGGLSDARNAGLDIISGNFVMFVDSDDVIHHRTLETLYREITDNNAEIATTLFRDFKSLEDLKSLSCDIGQYNINIFDIQKGCVHECLFNDYPYLHSSCAKLYKAKLFDDLRFKINLTYEDFHLKPYLLFSPLLKRIVCTNTNLYFYNCIDNHSSIMHSPLNEKKVSSMLYVLYDNYLLCKQNQITAVAKARAYKIVTSFVKLRVLSLDRKILKKILNKYYRKYFFKIMSTPNEYLSFKKKVSFVLTVFPSDKLAKYLKEKYNNELDLQYFNNL